MYHYMKGVFRWGDYNQKFKKSSVSNIFVQTGRKKVIEIYEKVKHSKYIYKSMY